ncbi:hypothetical protein [Streptomyces sp. NPDC048623]|uniref:hypothetical protein n=1 Tax=Streptomyces sp. NPDC048623 TaxID=3155761 RepID=UPI00343E4B47
MAKKKIQNEEEVIQWFREGRSYQWMTDMYMEKYNIPMSSSSWGNFRYRKGLDRRIARDDDLIPWAMEEEHRQQYPVIMLRAEARRRAKLKLSDDKLKRLESWKEMLKERDAVVHYEPKLDGFYYVPRQAGDGEFIRPPKAKTTKRRNADERHDENAKKGKPTTR